MDAVSDNAYPTPDAGNVFALARAQQARLAEKTGVAPAQGGSPAPPEPSTPPGSNADLSPEEQKVVEQLRARDREVRDHEQAHKRVGGALASQPTYSYQSGPDGKRYAIGGEVQIDTAPVPDNPEATVAKMQIVKAAALAPAEPSSTDRKVAAMADALRAQAQADLTEQRAAERRGEGVDVRV